MLIETPRTETRFVPAEVWASVMVGAAPLTCCPIEVALSMPTCPSKDVGALSTASRGRSQDLPANLRARRANCVVFSALRQIGRRRTTREPQHLARAANTRTRGL